MEKLRDQRSRVARLKVPKPEGQRSWTLPLVTFICCVVSFAMGEFAPHSTDSPSGMLAETLDERPSVDNRN